MDGFCFLPSVFSHEQSLSARDALWGVIQGNYETGKFPENRFWEIGDNPTLVIKIDKPHLCNQTVWDLITKPDLGKALANITNANTIQVWHSQVVWKPPSKNESGNAGWHRDAQYWPFWSHDGLFTAWIALSDVTPESGPVRFIPGSHLWEDVRGMDFFDKNINIQNKHLNAVHPDHKKINATLLMGEVSVHSSMTYHSSIANENQEPRIGMVVHFNTDAAVRIPVQGENADYLDQCNISSICPIIFQR